MTIQTADDPPRFELTPDPIRLVLGWNIDDDGTVLPALAAGPSPETWNGAVFYEETRKRAKATAKSLDRADRAMIRDARIKHVLDRIDRYLDQPGRRR